MTATLELAQQLIARRSVTPADDGCQALIAERLRPAGFGAETIAANGVTNAWLRVEMPLLFSYLPAIPMSCRRDHSTNGHPIRSSRRFATARYTDAERPT